MPRQVIIWERRFPPEELEAHLPEAAEWLHNCIHHLADAGYLVEEDASISVGEPGTDGKRTLLAHAVMNTEAGRRLIRR